MLDAKDFKDIAAELKGFEVQREKIIASSRDVIQLSKLIIHAVLRGDITKADTLAKKIRSDVKAIPSGEYETEMRSVALQEYVEALALLSFVKKGKIATRKELGVDTQSYLLGLCDLTGEFVRLAINKVINKDYAAALKIKTAVEEIYGQFLEFDLRNGNLRKKADSIKWNLKKLEEMALSLSIKA
mgnify:CR=1 FL=1